MDIGRPHRHLERGCFPPPVLAFLNLHWAFHQPDRGKKSVFNVPAQGGSIFRALQRPHPVAQDSEPPSSWVLWHGTGLSTGAL